MDSLLVANPNTVHLVMSLISTYGLPMIMVCGTIIFILYIVFCFLKSKGIIGDPLNRLLKDLEQKMDSSKLADENHYEILMEVLGKIMEKQGGYLSPEQTSLVLSYATKAFVSETMKLLLDIYVSNNIKDNEQSVKETISSEIESIIRKFDKEIQTLPNMTPLTIPTEEKITLLDYWTPEILEIFKTNDNEREVARKCKSLLKTTIQNQWVY